jgi:hypothetical protein
MKTNIIGNCVGVSYNTDIRDLVNLIQDMINHNAFGPHMDLIVIPYLQGHEKGAYNIWRALFCPIEMSNTMARKTFTKTCAEIARKIRKAWES